MTVIEDAPPDIVEDSVDTKPRRKRGVARKQPDPATDRRRGPRPKKDFAKSFSEEVHAAEEEVARMRERWEREDTLANAARAKADAQLEAIRLREAHIAHQKQSPLYREATQ